MRLIEQPITKAFVTKEVREARLACCNQCEQYQPNLYLCTKCSCIMPAKARLTKSRCPLDKWRE